MPIQNSISIAIKGEIVLGGGPPPAETFYLLAQNSDRLLAQNSDNLVAQNYV